MNNNRIAISIGILIAVVCLCLTAVVAVAGGAYLLGFDKIQDFFSTDTPTPLPPAVTVAPPEQEVSPTPQTSQATAEPEATAALPEDVTEQMDEIQAQVERIRGLESTAPVKRELLTVDQLRGKVENDFFADYTEEDVADDVKVLSSLGLLDPNFDLYNFYLDLYTEQIAGITTSRKIRCMWCSTKAFSAAALDLSPTNTPMSCRTRRIMSAKT